MGDHLSNIAAPALNDLSFLSRRRYTCQLAEKDFLLSFCFVYLVYFHGLRLSGTYDLSSIF